MIKIVLLTLAVCDSLKLIMYSFGKQTIPWFRVSSSYFIAHVDRIRVRKEIFLTTRHPLIFNLIF